MKQVAVYNRETIGLLIIHVVQQYGDVNDTDRSRVSSFLISFRLRAGSSGFSG